ncbi:MAG: phosphate ABC transporter substrate-binding protein [Clostridiales bacterium]|nr:phosphate ABC transporter substrate-binding protein [Clostridiales bacterium]
MKRISALVLALMMVLSLAACGSSTDSTADTTESSTESSTEETDTTEEEADAVEEEADTAEEADAAEEEADVVEEETDTTETNVDLSGTVSTNGSTSMEKVMSILIEAFEEQYPDVTVTYDATGSGAGITAATEGSADIGLASRNLKDEETGLTAYVVAIDGIAVIINPSNGVEDLTLEQIAGLFNGTITNWSEVGGEDMEVAVIGREAGSGTRDGFESVVGVEDECVYDQELTSTGSVITAVAQNQYAIGYASLSEAAEDDSVKVISVDGVEATEETVKDGSYAIQRNFNMVVSDSATLSDAAQAFLDFCLSPEVADYIAQAGAIQP